MDQTVNTGKGEVIVAPKNADAKTLQRHHTLFFGKNKGKTIAQMLEENPSWILFAHAQVAFVKFPDDVITEAQDRVSGKITDFKLDEKDLEEHGQVLTSVTLGLDSYANNGVRQLHGIGNDVAVHRTLDYYRKLTSFLIAQQKKKAAEADPFATT